MSRDTSTPQLDAHHPWPGLAAYDEGSKKFFFGREADSAELLRLIRQSPLVLLYGKSGLGKSSMLKAGVFPQLRQAKHLPVHLRLDYSQDAGKPLLDQAMAELLKEAAEAGLKAPEPAQGESLWAYLQRKDWPLWTRDNFPLTPVLVFDQFEELFSRRASPEHIQSVLEDLADLVGDRLPDELASQRERVELLNLESQQYRVVLSFRSDFLAEVRAWEKQAQLPRPESLHLTAMSRDQAVQAVESAGATVLEPGTAAQIVDFLLARESNTRSTGEGEVEPVLLSLCCYRLNILRGDQPKIDATLLQRVGKDILKGFLADALKDMRPEVAMFIEDNLIQGHYRSSYPLAEVVPGQLRQDELDALVQSRLLRVDPMGGVPRVELIHDRVVSVVREARDTRRTREQAEKAAQAQREQERLAQAEGERARISRSRNGLAVAVLVLVGLAVGLFWSLKERSAALAEAKIQSNRAEEEANKARGALLYAEQQLEKLKEQLPQPNARDPAPATGAEKRPQDLVAEAQERLKDSLDRVGVADAATTKQTPEPVAVAAPPPPDQKLSAAPATTAGKPQPKTDSAAPAGKTLTIDWRLNSGGCLKGDVAVRGDAKFWLETTGDKVIAKEDFRGTGSGFTVVVTDTGKPVPPTNQGYYDVETSGEWSHPNGRKFNSTGVDRVYVDKDGVTLRRVNLLKFKTVCPG